MKYSYYNRTVYPLPDFIETAAIDFPSQEKITADHKIYIAGWILSRFTVKIFLIKKDLTRIEILFNKSRKDVFRKLKGIENISNEESKIGFGMNVQDISDDFSLFINQNGIDYKWADFSIKEATDLSINFLYENEKVEFKFKSDTLGRIFCTSAFDTSEIIKTFGENQLNGFLDLINYFLTTQGLTKIIKNIDTENFPSISGTQKTKILGSIFLGHTNFIFCLDGELRYILIQYVNSLDGIYFPDFEKIFVSSHVGKNTLLYLIEFIASNQKNMLLECKERKKACLYFGFGRPYHYMYDQAPVVYFLSENKIIPENVDIYSSQENNYLDFQQLCHLNVKYKSPKEIRDYIDDNNKFIFKIGLNFCTEPKSFEKLLLLKKFDDHVKLFAVQTFAHSVENKKISRSDFVLWIGLTGQKRSWTQQVEGAIKIIEKIKNLYKRPCIVFDGWTASVARHAGDILEEKNDSIILDQILDQVNINDLDIINLIGSDLTKKIFVASKIDFFVANALTGSINVARVCGKKGIGHAATLTYDIAESHHIHTETFLLNKIYVKDIPDEKNKRIDYCSYEIDMDVFLKFFGECLEKGNDKKYGSKLSFYDKYFKYITNDQ
jgi:hypothetical protein